MGNVGFGLYASTPDSAIFYHSADYYSAGMYPFVKWINYNSSSASITQDLDSWGLAS